MKALKIILALFFVLVLSFFAFRPLLNQGFFPIHDDTQIARVYEMSKSLSDGQLPVRWVEDLGYGYGYPIFNFYDPVPYYVGGMINLLVNDPLLATKTMIFLGIIISAISMYLLAGEFWGPAGGILASIFYIYAPYHAVDVYVRGDIAESWAYSFIPLIFLGLWKIYKKPRWKGVMISSISFALVIASHNLTAMMVSPFIALFIIYLIYRSGGGKKTLVYFFVSLTLGVLLSAFYWIPAIFEMNYTNVLSQVGGGANFRDHFVCLEQLWTSPWGYGGSTRGCNDGLSFMIGKYHIIFSAILFIISAFMLIFKKYINKFEEEKEKLSIIVISFLGFMAAAFFTLGISMPIWELIKPMAFFQYPWRFLIMAVFFASFISGSFLWFAQKLISNRITNFLLALILCIFIVFVSTKFFIPQTVLHKGNSFYVSDYSLKWTASKTSDEYMPKGFQKPENFSEIADFSNLNSQNLKIINIRKSSTGISMDYDLNKSERAVLPIAYFPSWQGYIDNKSISLAENKKGMSVNLLVGKHNLTLKLSQTPLEIFSDIVSLAGILCLFAGIILLKRKYD